MDPVTTAIIAAVSSGLETAAGEAVSDLYQNLKGLIKRRLGISGPVSELEDDPDSKECQKSLAENLAAQKADQDPEIFGMARELFKALQETDTGRKALAKYSIAADGAQLGVIGDGTRIEGGLHSGSTALPIRDALFSA